MHVGANTGHASGFWVGVPRGAGQQASLVLGAPFSSAVHKTEHSKAHASLEQMVSYLDSSLRQAVTAVLIESASDEVIAALERFFEASSPIWQALLSLEGKRISQPEPPQLNLVELAKGAQSFYPKQAGRVYIRAAIYLDADSVALAQAGEFPGLRNDGFLVRHQMLLTACLIAAENLNVSDGSTTAVARALWDHWVSHVESAGANYRDPIERLVEDAYLKAAADESEYEDDDEPEVWNPRKVASGGQA